MLRYRVTYATYHKGKTWKWDNYFRSYKDALKYMSLKTYDKEVIAIALYENEILLKAFKK